MNSKIWYAQIVKPTYAPPSWVFGVVWPVLYIMIGLAFYFFWKAEGSFEQKKLGYILFVVQFLLNLSFMPVFFGLKSFLGGLVVCILLVLSIYWTMHEFYKFSHIATILLHPYMAWCIFATFLSYKIFLLNR